MHTDMIRRANGDNCMFVLFGQKSDVLASTMGLAIVIHELIKVVVASRRGRRSAERKISAKSSTQHQCYCHLGWQCRNSLSSDKNQWCSDSFIMQYLFFTSFRRIDLVFDLLNTVLLNRCRNR